KVWVALGGSVSTLQGIHWFIPVRPVGLACSRYIPARMANAIGRATGVLDGLIASLPHSPFRTRQSSLKAEPLSSETLLECLNALTHHCRLRPHYDSRSLSALIHRIEQKTKHGELRRVLLRDEADNVAGWYLYQAKPGGLAEVLQVAARGNRHVD